jgi:hypothetical protein
MTLRTLELHRQGSRWSCYLSWVAPLPWLPCDVVVYHRWLGLAVGKALWLAWRRQRSLRGECQAWGRN